MTKIREARQRREMSISAFSHETLTNAAVISQVERRKATASRRVQEAVAEFLGLPMEKLFDAEGWAL